MEVFANRTVEHLTFFQWLNAYEWMTKKEFKELQKYKQDNYRTEYEIYCKSR
ncbi:hypothetical protein SDC9_52639 [bioreactor metagenome]|uniref:Uncharacterized protein n=1 Tax=bioreactor metagenome TaxID=1076179 RepID=A0A644WR76_9ZZZZ